MRFSMMKVVGSQRGNGFYEYESTIMERGDALEEHFRKPV